jgi:hypothetical protein
MTKYQCDQNHVFIFPTIAHAGLNEYTWTEEKICPQCDGHNSNISEFIEPVVPEQKTVAVLVVDLVTGENLVLNKALVDGYEIVGRYAKAYTLEKKAPLPEKDYAQEAIEKAYIANLKTQEQANKQ